MLCGGMTSLLAQQLHRSMVKLAFVGAGEQWPLSTALAPGCTHMIVTDRHYCHPHRR